MSAKQMVLSRRGFIKSTAAVAGGVAIGFGLSSCSEPAPPKSPAGFAQANVFLAVSPEGKIVFQLPKADMGQGVYHGLASVVAAELNVNPSDIIIEHAQYNPVYADEAAFNMMITGGSASMRVWYQPLREAAATLRELLRQAGATHFNVDKEVVDLSVDGLVVGDEIKNLAEIVPAARELPMPESAALRPDSALKSLGVTQQRIDGPDKATGKAVYGVDITLPNMVTAVMLRSPHLAGKVKSFDASKAKSMYGVQDVIEIDGAIAVLADNYWAANQAAKQVQVVWDKGSLAGVDNEAIATRQKEMLLPLKADFSAELQSDERVVEFEYSVPYLAHAAMEPLCATADVRDDGVDIWCGNQALDFVVGNIAKRLNRPKETVVLHNLFLGGAFGRRLFPDYAIEAAMVSAAVGRPVKLMWSRENDMQHDFYRPSGRAIFQVKLQGNKVKAVQGNAVANGIYESMLPIMLGTVADWLPKRAVKAVSKMAGNSDPSIGEGLTELHYDFGEYSFASTSLNIPVPVGFWRSVGHSINAFFLDTFVDELAVSLGEDPLAFRLNHLPNESKQAKMLRHVAELADWGNAPEGQYQGVCCHESFETTVAQVVNVSVMGGSLKVHKVVCLVDCGKAINPDIVKAQMEGGINFALTAALYGEISLDDGRVQQSNFHDYPIIRMHESPDIEVHIVESTAPPTGVGEPGVPPLAPALGNAIFAATGKRLRDLPFKLS